MGNPNTGTPNPVPQVMRETPPPAAIRMTVKEAQMRYALQAVYAPTLPAAINYMIDNGHKTEFRNDSYLDALTLTQVMFNRSKNSIRMLTGEKIDGFIEVLKAPFTEALKRIRASGGFVHIVTLGPVNNCMDALLKEYKDTLEVIPATANIQVQHYMLCDSKMARIEEVHDPLLDNTDASAIRAKVFFNDSAKTKVFEDSFDVLWAKLKSQITPHAATQSS